MELYSWVWVLKSFESKKAPVKILPIILYKNKLPFEMIYSDSGWLVMGSSPKLSLMLEIFKKFQNSLGLENFAEGVSKNNEKVLITQERFCCEIQFSRFSHIHAVRNKNFQVFYHVVEFKNDHYNSIPFTKKFGNKIKIDDILLEKILIKNSLVIISNVEKVCNLYTNFIELKYFQSDSQEIFLENCKKIVNTESYKKRSIYLIPLIKYSTQFKMANSFSMTNITFSMVPNDLKLKPRLRISSKKIASYLNLPKLPQNLKEIECQGHYCGLSIKITSISKRRKINLKKYMEIPHDLIKSELRSLNFPMSEPEFDNQFSEICRSLFLTHPDLILNESDSLKYQETTILCIVCYKLFSKYSSLQTSIKNLLL